MPGDWGLEFMALSKSGEETEPTGLSESGMGFLIVNSGLPEGEIDLIGTFTEFSRIGRLSILCTILFFCCISFVMIWTCVLPSFLVVICLVGKAGLSNILEVWFPKIFMSFSTKKPVSFSSLL